MLQKIRVQLIRFRLSKKALSLMRKGKEFVTYGKKMVARGKVYLKKGKALIAKEKAMQQKTLIIEDSLEVRDVGCTASVAVGVPDSYGFPLSRSKICS